MPKRPSQTQLAIAEVKPGTPLFVTWDDNDPSSRQLAIYNACQAGEKLNESMVNRSHAIGSSLFANVSPNTSVRDGFDRCDYDYFRDEEASPVRPKAKMKACNRVYKRVGLIRNVTDLMTDFAIAGVKPNHPNERINNFYNEWFERVGGRRVTERIVCYALRMGTAVLTRSTAKISIPMVEEMKKSTAEADIEVPPSPQVYKREIPWKYHFHNPITLDVVEPELTIAAGGEFIYAVRLSPNVISAIKRPTTDAQKALIKLFSAETVNKVKAGQSQLILNPEKTRSFSYKRDDWEVWADPLCFSILDDINLLQKMKLSDLAALDGAISCIRVWKLGSLENKIMPTPDAINQLAQMLMNNVGGGVMDLVYGPAIDLIETSTEVHRFLGESKYTPVLTSIYTGLGIPPALTGAVTDGGLNQNFINLKTLSGRIQYCRNLVTDFWNHEFKLVQKAMGFRQSASVSYDRMNLIDEASEKKLLLDLCDRNVISIQTLQERFGEDPVIEDYRLRREERRRKKKLIPTKTSPFHSPHLEDDKKKALLSAGVVTPSQVGVELEEKKPGEMTGLEMEAKFRPKKDKTGTKPKGQPGQGRPRNSNDKQKRKTKKVKPALGHTVIRNMAKAQSAQTKIDEVMKPIFLKVLGKSNLRQLTTAEFKQFEEWKFYALFNLNDREVNEDTLKEMCKTQMTVPTNIEKAINKAIADYTEENGEPPTVDLVRHFQAHAYAIWMSA